MLNNEHRISQPCGKSSLSVQLYIKVFNVLSPTFAFIFQMIFFLSHLIHTYLNPWYTYRGLLVIDGCWIVYINITWFLKLSIGKNVFNFWTHFWTHGDNSLKSGGQIQNNMTFKPANQYYSDSRNQRWPPETFFLIGEKRVIFQKWMFQNKWWCWLLWTLGDNSLKISGQIYIIITWPTNQIFNITEISPSQIKDGRLF